MDKVYEISLLLDFYGQLLTERQYEILDLHYNNDYTLSEIAEQLNISRQGVYDNEKRGRALLNEYENKLGLLSKFSEQKQKAEEVRNLFENIETSGLSRHNAEIVERAKRELAELVNSI
ncbi:YlxM family DNA-binding protein [Ruminiclostridium cellobioparum]|uniref:YlxM family DNA-binding protein n=1 Tax=Ruminiclostridium cellobioparum TaxID=29355 RepID=UPI00048535E0|nr:YlxM family DNA-binding protein [Ruminiclostridium cellobioparum]